MKRYYGLDIQAMQDNNLSPIEWMILENIHFLSTDTGWCFSSKQSLAEHHNISRQMITKYVASLVERGWIKKNTKHHLKVTKKWINIMTTKVSTDNKSSDNKSCTRVTTKVSTLPIKKELKREKPTQKEIAVYVKEKNLSVNPKDFFDYFEAGNWIDSKGNKVRNWKQKILTWNNHSNKSKTTTKPQTKFII